VASEVHDIAIGMAELKATMIQRLDDIVRRIDNYERRNDKLAEEVDKLKTQVNLWKGGLLALSLIYPIAVKYFLP